MAKLVVEKVLYTPFGCLQKRFVFVQENKVIGKSKVMLHLQLLFYKPIQRTKIHSRKQR